MLKTDCSIFVCNCRRKVFGIEKLANPIVSYNRNVCAGRIPNSEKSSTFKLRNLVRNVLAQVV